VFEDDACAALENAAKAGACGLLTVELDKRAGDDAPRVAIRRFQPLESLARSTRLRMEITLRDASDAGRLAPELDLARGGNGTVRFRIALAGGGEAIVLVGRDFRLDAELAARIDRITGEGSVSLSAQEPPRLALVG
jgi:DNA polymerase-3 subunit alpha